MLNPIVVDKLIEEQIAKSVDAQVTELFATDAWVNSIENKIVEYAQQRILTKFANSSTLPEIIDAVKLGVTELFANGLVPGVDQYIDPVTIKTAINQAVNDNILTAVRDLENDPEWVRKIENLTIESMVQRVITELSTVDVTDTIRRRIDENMLNLVDSVVKKLQTPGIQNYADQCELTVLDENVVVENKLTAKSIDVVDSVSVRNLAVTGSINTDNQAWNVLSDNITEKTLNKLSNDWRNLLVQQVSEEIQKNGISFDQVKIDGHSLIADGRLAHSIVESSLKSVGVLHDLTVAGEASINDTVSVKKKRLGINTHEPEMALSVWDEEVSILAGKIKDKSAYIGTGRAQSLSIGVNRSSAIEIDVDGVTAVKKLRVGVHRISHGTEVPNYSGTKGDIVFNANPSVNTNVFAWQCLGGFKWKIVRSVE